MREYKRGADYVELRPDRAGTHDIGGPMAIIQFLSSGKDRIALPAAIVCDHLVMANAGAIPDLKVADKSNYETYDSLPALPSATALTSGLRARASVTKSSSRITTSRAA